MKKSVLLYWVFFILFSSIPVFAADIVETSHEEVVSTILPDGTASFYLYVTNHQGGLDTFRVVKPFVYWSWLMEADQVSVREDDTDKILVNLTPFSTMDPGDYGIRLDVTSINDPDIYSDEFLEIKVVTYDQVLKTELSLPEDINPNKEQLFRVRVINNYDITLEDLEFVLFSEYFEGSKKFDIGPYQTVTLEIPVEFSGTVKEGENDLLLKFYYDNKLVLEREESMNIGYYTDVAGKGTPEDGFLYHSETFVRTNTGNVISKEVYEKRVSWFEKLFTSYTVEPTSVIRDGTDYRLIWEFDLQPDQTKTIVVETSYRMFSFIVLIILIVLGFLYYWFKKDISLSKRLISMKKGEHGIYSMNVVLSLKNKTLRDIRNIKIMDSLGGRVEEISNYGMFKPNILKSESGKSTKLIWNIPKLGKRDEIILQYTMKYKPYIFRSMPPAVAKYFTKGRTIFVRSKRVDVFS